MNLFRKSSDLLVVVALCTAAIVVVLLGMQNIFRVLLALPLVFILPGYSLVAAMYANRTLAVEIHTVFAIALSVSVTAIGGLILNFTSQGLNAESWLLFLSVTTLAASGLALIRRNRLAVFTNSDLRLTFNWSQIAMFGLAVVLVFVAIRLTRTGIVNQPVEGFTQLWMLPPAENMQNAVQIGITNEEATTTTYRLIVKAGNDVLGDWRDIELEPGEQWQDYFRVDGQTNVEAALYRAHAPNTIYRNVSLTLNSQLSPP